MDRKEQVKVVAGLMILHRTSLEKRVDGVWCSDPTVVVDGQQVISASQLHVSHARGELK